MGYKDTIKEVLEDNTGIYNKYFDVYLSSKNYVKQIKNVSSQVVKARFAINVTAKVLPPVLLDIEVTVWGTIKHEIAYNKLDTRYTPYLEAFIKEFVTGINLDILEALDNYKQALKAA